MPELLWRVIRFAVPTLLTALAPVAAVAAIARQGGEVFLALAIGQAVGGVGVLVCSVGANVSGPNWVLNAPPRQRTPILMATARSQVKACLVAAPVLAIGAVLLAPEGQSLMTVLAMLAMLVTACSPAWWLVGVGEPSAVTRVDALPRVAAALAGAALIVSGQPAVWYPVLALTFAAVAYLRFYLVAQRRGALSPAGVGVPRLPVEKQSLAISVVSGSYTSATLPLVHALAPMSGPAFAGGLRMLSYWNLSTVAVSQALQGWCAKSRRRTLVGLYLLAGQGLALGAALAVIGPPLTRWLLGAAVTPSGATFWWLGATYAVLAVNTGFSKLVWFPVKGERLVLAAVVAAAAVGVSLLVLVVRDGGAASAVAAIACAEVVLLSVLAVAAFRRFPFPRDSDG